MTHRIISRYPREILVSLALSLMVLICYHPVGEFGFINYDDTIYVTDNEHVRQGLTMEGVIWAFRDMKSSSNWHPVTWISHMLDWQLFRADAGGHHRTNLLFHLINALLLFFLLHLMTGTLWRSACVAALFAIHPINVESVAWVAERKNVLSMFFGLLTLLFYGFYVRKPAWKRYLPVAVFYLFGLMAKPMLVTLPLLMLLLDLWPLGRLPIHPWPKGGSPSPCGRHPRATSMPMAFSGLLLEKIPLLLMAAVSIAVTILAAQTGGALTTLARFPLAVRLANALHAYTAYIGKLFWPRDLTVFYPYPGSPLLWKTILSGILITFLTVLVLKQVRLRPYLLVGWFWFLGTLIPVIGLVQVGLQAMADRYAYLPLIGLFVMLVWGITDISGTSGRFRKIAVLLFALMILAEGILTREQLRFWQSSRSLFAHALSVTERNDIAHSNLADSLFREGDWEGAASHYQEAIRIHPGYPNHYNNLGAVLVHQGKTEEAIVQYRATLTLDPRHAGALFNMGLAMESRGRWQEAAGFYRKVLREHPEHRHASRQQGVLAMKRGHHREAAAYFQEALRRRSSDPELTKLLLQARERMEAMQK